MNPNFEIQHVASSTPVYEASNFTNENPKSGHSPDDTIKRKSQSPNKKKAYAFQKKEGSLLCLSCLENPNAAQSHEEMPPNIHHEKMQRPGTVNTMSSGMQPQGRDKSIYKANHKSLNINHNKGMYGSSDSKAYSITIY